jgi:hypothetical protein
MKTTVGMRMTASHRDRVGKGFELLAEGLRDFVDEVMTESLGGDWPSQLNNDGNLGARVLDKNDPQVQLRAITEHGYRFKNVLSRAQQGFASELREDRNKWAHNQAISGENAIRTLDTGERLLRAVDANDSADDLRKVRLDVTRVVFEEQTRQVVRRSQNVDAPSKGIRPWREVAIPHDDVATGQFNASEFAADLDKVSRGLGAPDYADPNLFFARTYLTSGLRELLTKALQRLSGDLNASPVVNLQTNFGGGKTHSMLSLFHLFSGRPASTLSQELQELVQSSKVAEFDSLGVKRVVLVGTALKPGSVSVKEDGTRVHTIWGELAWQLGGAEAYEIIRDSDENRTNPGSSLGLLFDTYGPALVLIDEWVAYARQLVDRDDLPAGSFDTQFTFAQTLTEVVKSSPGCMLVVSVPASDASAGDETVAGAMIEVGGENGRRALDRLQNVIRRVADQWRPSSKDEAFEIVRRRLFKDSNSDQINEVAAISKQFVQMYRDGGNKFPKECLETEYEQRIRNSYPIHPELLDRLYRDWATLERFQRTRGVLHLMSTIVHSLWTSNDSSPLIMPGNVPLSDSSVSQAMSQYLEDAWKPLLDSEIDSDSSISFKIDAERPVLGQRALTRRIARTIFIGSAPTLSSPHKGLEEHNLHLGVSVPGDSLGNFSLATDLLSQRSAYFYQQGTRVWFDTHPSVQRTAQELAESLKSKPELAWQEIVQRLGDLFRSKSPFSSVSVGIQASADVLDNDLQKLAVLHPEYTYSRKDGAASKGFLLAKDVLEKRGGAQRVQRNTVVVVVSDADRSEPLNEVARSYLAWRSILDRAEEMNLDPQTRIQAQGRLDSFSQLLDVKIRESYQWVAFLSQNDVTSDAVVELDKFDVTDAPACQRVASKLKRSGILVDQISASALGAELHRSLGTSFLGSHMSVGKAWEYFTRFPYLPKLTSRGVLDDAIRELPMATLLENDEFAIAESFDEKSGKYRNIILPLSNVQCFAITDATLILDHSIASAQLEDKTPLPVPTDGTGPVLPDPSPVVGPLRLEASISASSEYNRLLMNLSRDILALLEAEGVSTSLDVRLEINETQNMSESSLRALKENLQSLGFRWTIN